MVRVLQGHVLKNVTFTFVQNFHSSKTCTATCPCDTKKYMYTLFIIVQIFEEMKFFKQRKI